MSERVLRGRRNPNGSVMRQRSGVSTASATARTRPGHHPAMLDQPHERTTNERGSAASRAGRAYVRARVRSAERSRCEHAAQVAPGRTRMLQLDGAPPRPRLIRTAVANEEVGRVPACCSPRRGTELTSPAPTEGMITGCWLLDAERHVVRQAVRPRSCAGSEGAPRSVVVHEECRLGVCGRGGLGGVGWCCRSAGTS
jgi:hypothetical protein